MGVSMYLILSRINNIIIIITKTNRPKARCPSLTVNRPNVIAWNVKRLKSNFHSERSLLKNPEKFSYLLTNKHKNKHRLKGLPYGSCRKLWKGNVLVNNFCQNLFTVFATHTVIWMYPEGLGNSEMSDTEDKRISRTVHSRWIPGRSGR